jgi:putative transposase
MPHFGGIVERMIGTAMRAVNGVPGATGRSVAERGERDPEAGAAMTLGELDRFLATYFAGEYHRRLHSHHGLSPLTKWKQGIFGSTNNKGSGPPPPVNDPARLLIDFLPLARRRITPRGIAWGNINYMDDLLRPFIANDKGEYYLVRRDPRDVSFIWFLSPEDQRYYQIRSRDITRPSTPLWEVEEAKRKLRGEGRRDYDETALFRAIEAQRAIIVSATKNKSSAKRARLAQSRRENSIRSSVPSHPPRDEPSHAHAPWHESGADDSDADGVFEIED